MPIYQRLFRQKLCTYSPCFLNLILISTYSYWITYSCWIKSQQDCQWLYIQQKHLIFCCMHLRQQQISCCSCEISAWCDAYQGCLRFIGFVAYLQSKVNHMRLKCRLSLWEQETRSTHVHNKSVAGFSLCPLCSTELSPICPSLNICCGNAAGAAGLSPPLERWEHLWLAAAVPELPLKSQTSKPTCWHGFPDCPVVIDTSLC